MKALLLIFCIGFGALPAWAQNNDLVDAVNESISNSRPMFSEIRITETYKDFIEYISELEESYYEQRRYFLKCSYDRSQHFMPAFHNGFIQHDKIKHCALSCIISVGCSPQGATIAGFAKEFMDAFDKKKGNSDIKDIEANMVGINYANKELSPILMNPSWKNERCMDHCFEHFDPDFVKEDHREQEEPAELVETAEEIQEDHDADSDTDAVQGLETEEVLINEQE